MAPNVLVRQSVFIDRQKSVEVQAKLTVLVGDNGEGRVTDALAFFRDILDWPDLFNGTSLRLVYAPKHESSGHLTFRFKYLVQTQGRPMAGALAALLGVERVTDTGPVESRLTTVLRESRRSQNDVSTALAGQVLEALWELVRGFQRANRDTKGQLLDEALRESQGRQSNDVYGGLLTTPMRVVTVDETSVMFGMAPWRMGPEWHAPIIDFRERTRSGGLMTRADLEDFDIEIRELYLDIAARIANPAPPRLCNTDGDPLVLTTLTFAVQGTVDEVAKRLAPLAQLPGDEPDEEVLDVLDGVERDGTGAMTSATLSWKKAGNKKHKEWSNTILGTIRLTAGRIVAEVNSEKRARRGVRELKKRLGSSVTLISSETTDLPAALKMRPAQPPEVPAPELVAMEEELFKKHMDAWIDTKVPALGNKTPRVVARTALGRERLAALVSTFERGQVERLPNGRALLNELRVKLGLDPS